MDIFNELITNLRANKKRILLTAFGVFWGMLLLVLLLGFGAGLKNGVDSQFAGTANTIYLWRAAVTQIPYKGYPAGRWVGLDDEDLQAIQQQVTGADIVIGINEVGGWSQPQYVTNGANSGSYVIQGSHPEVPAMNGYHLLHGRFINTPDLDDSRKAAVLGRRVSGELFGAQNPVGESITIAGLRFQVVGVFEPLSTGPQSAIDSELVLIPNTTLRLSFDQLSYINLIRITPKSGYNATAIENQARQILQQRRSIHPDDHGVYGSYNTQAEYDKLMSLFDGITLFSWIIAIGTLISGAVGVGNVMLIAVRERTQEIGLRRAIGAKSIAILRMIIQETLVIVLSSGYLGLLIGVNALLAVAFLVEHFAPYSAVFRSPEVDLSVLATALLTLVVCGVLSALYPALRATRISPVEALKD